MLIRKLLSVFLFIFLASSFSIQDTYGAQTVEKDVSFYWDEMIDVSGNSFPIKIHIPAKVTILDLPISAEPGANINIQTSISFRDGASLTIEEETFQIDDAVKQANSNNKEFDISMFQTLVRQFLTNIIVAQLGIDEDQAIQFASTLVEYTQLSLINQVIIKTSIKGPAVHTPSEVSLWINQPAEIGITIDSSAKDSDMIDLVYEYSWVLVLKLGISSDVYDNPILNPLITRLTQLIGLPLQKTLGEINADENIIHQIVVKNPFELTSQELFKIIIILAILVIIVIYIIIKHPRKPRWE